jgi:hypothetical protein
MRRRRRSVEVEVADEVERDGSLLVGAERDDSRVQVWPG